MDSYSWIDLPRARARLAELEIEMGKLEGERELIRGLLGAGPAEARPEGVPAPPAFPVRVRVRRSEPTAKPAVPGPSSLDLVEQIMRANPGRPHWTVVDLLAALETLAPERVADGEASSRLSSALARALHSRVPRFLTGRAKGRSRRYWLNPARS